MSDTLAGLLSVALVVACLIAAHRPLGDYMALVFTSEKHWRAERLIYRAVGVNPDGEQRWTVYLRSLLAFSLVSVLGLYLLLRIQGNLPWSNGTPGMPAFLAWNTAISFVTNTNWQNYGGESTLGHVAQFAGLAVQNFASAAVGLAVAIALVRGFARGRVSVNVGAGAGVGVSVGARTGSSAGAGSRASGPSGDREPENTGRLGNFWVDLVRGCTRILLPLSIVAALVLIAAGVVQNLHGFTDVTTLAGGHQSIPGGPVASQEAIKEIGTNGGGFYNANSAHPFENPAAWTSLLQVFLMLVIPFSLPRTFGRMVGDLRQGYAIVSVMAGFWALSLTAMWIAETHSRAGAIGLAGAAMEGKEVRFGIPGSALYATSTTLTSTGAVNSFHDSYSPLGGGMAMVNMMTGEIVPGGVGSGLYGMLILAIITVFIAGLMVGRTPEYLGKKLGPGEIKLAGLYLLITPSIVLIGSAQATALPGPRSVRTNDGPHGLSEIIYAFTSMGNNNGSAFGGLGTNTDFYNLAGGAAMMLGRFLPIVLVLALAGRLAESKTVPATEGTLPTHRPLFAGLLAGVIILVVALTYFPGFALAPLAEGLS